MSAAKLEHVNVTVTNPVRTAALLCDLCGWHIRWEGPSMNNGRTIHVGSDTAYLALYSDGQVASDFPKGQPFNHVGLQVDDLAAAEKTVVAAGLTPFSHGAYTPGPSTFYFLDWDGIEFEMVSYE